MIELGKRQLLTVVREKEFGVYLAEDPKDETAVLLPAKQVPAGTRAGDRLEVFIYRDSEDRLIATTREPKLQVGETAVLTVKETGRIGAFLDMGLEKDVLLQEGSIAASAQLPGAVTLRGYNCWTKQRYESHTIAMQEAP